ncbi:MAG: hypothetical protein K9M99_02690 [Candidatus Cloacimonetes bacterium]|nr:hypothetical protein [Candidatus Cloacimonadota bacterium]
MRKCPKKTRTLDHIQKYCIEMPAMRIVEKIMGAGQENPFVSQFYSVLISRKIDLNILHAPLNFIVCMDIFKAKRVFDIKGKDYYPEEKALLLTSFINAIIAAQNIVHEANNQDLGTFYMSNTLEQVKTIRKRWNLPKFVIPLVNIAAGYPDESPKEHFNFPQSYIYFEDEYKPIEDYNLMDLIYKLNNDEGLIEYYREITEQETSQVQHFADWMELLQFNCQIWDDKTKEFIMILKECGVKIKC